MLSITEPGMKTQQYFRAALTEKCLPHCPIYWFIPAQGNPGAWHTQGAGRRSSALLVLHSFQTSSPCSQWHFSFPLSFLLVVLFGFCDRHFCFTSLGL